MTRDALPPSPGLDLPPEVLHHSVGMVWREKPRRAGAVGLGDGGAVRYGPAAAASLFDGGGGGSEGRVNTVVSEGHGYDA